ncbi:MAG: sterol desaturase family protein [Erythrobacter sp.]|uniref:sterol desaturase family protein n=1 Tax=Erythrobacter sp. TaxID=1042 RepID=UPI002625A3E8|nr:sterol desaturase family protein [Erythrobacter sp.]MDJ0977097.1 sterol desaturase family protein [Erythrobacter sp.]
MTDATITHFTDLIAEHFANVFYFDLGRYLIAAGVASLILLVFRRWAEARRIQTRRASRAGRTREVLSSLRTVFFFGVTTLATLIGVETGVIRFEEDNASWITIALHFVIVVLVHDAYFYWAHRAMHSKTLFRATHLHHHKSRTPTPWTAYSFSTWEAVIEAAFMPLFLLAISLTGYAIAAFAVFLFLWHMIIRNVMAHTGHEIFPAGWVDTPWLDWISTTTHHDLHHSSGHNYGFYFTWWDRWMGTEHPRYKQEFRKNAKPLGWPESWTFKGRPAEQAAVLLSALLAASASAGLWLGVGALAAA